MVDGRRQRLARSERSPQDPRDPRMQRPPQDPRDPRMQRSPQDPRDPRMQRSPQDPRSQRDPRQFDPRARARDQRDPRSPRLQCDPRAREQRDPRGQRLPRPPERIFNDPRENVRSDTTYSAQRARHAPQGRVDDHTVGSHVRRTPQERPRRKQDVAEALVRRARRRRIVAGIIAVVIVVGAALVMGILAYRGSVGSTLALRDSDAIEALSPAETGSVSYTLIAAELGAVAEPLENPGPDLLLLARFDSAAQTLALINIPPNLQVSVDNQSTTLSSLAQTGDAKMITALAAFTKLPISHFVKLEEGDFVALIDTLGGIEIDIDQVIDDPTAGDVYLPAGTTTLTGATSLVYMRASNVRLGLQDKLRHQNEFVAQVMQEIFGVGTFATTIDAVDDFLQTDYSLSQLEAFSGWFRDKTWADVILANLPGYTSAAASMTDVSQQRFISSYDDFQTLVEALEAGNSPSQNSTDTVAAADPASFVLEIQNGTVVPGLAAATQEKLAAAGFNIGEVGNADVPNYEQTLVVYRGEEGAARAKSVIEALGMGRAVGTSEYYSFTGDVVLIIGLDYAPVS